MKHRLLTTLTAALIALSAWAYDVQIDGIYYDINRSAIVTSGDSKYQGDIIIPASVTYYGKTYSVDGIRGGAFYGCTGLTSISIPNSITAIGNRAFEGCTNLTSVTINNSNGSMLI